MTSEELLTLSISQLVNRVFEDENIIQELRDRITSLESELVSERGPQSGEPDAGLPEGGSAEALASENPEPDLLKLQNSNRPANPVSISPRSPSVRIQRHRHHRRGWDKRLRSALIVGSVPSRRFLAVGLVLVVAAIFIGLVVVGYLYANAAQPPAPPPLPQPQ